jgi:hypothetical protein
VTTRSYSTASAFGRAPDGAYDPAGGPERAAPPASPWTTILGLVPALERARLHAQSPLDPGRRLYFSGERALKVVAHRLQRSQDDRVRDLAGEYEVLRHLRDVRGVPIVEGLHRGQEGDVLVMSKIDAVSCNLHPSVLARALAFPRLFALVLRLSARGVVHGDITPANVMLGPTGAVWLVDFDQAQRANPLRSFVANIFGGTINGSRVQSSMLSFAKRMLRKTLPHRAITILGGARRILTGARREYIPPIEPLPAKASEKLRTLHEAWRVGAASDANAPGEGVCYYSLQVDGFTLPGERPWTPRWSLFSQHVDFRSARVLELGCNMGLLSTFALRAGASAAHGVDIDRDILRANALVQRGFGVTYETWTQNFDSAGPWEEQLAAFRPTIVTALSVLNWVADKGRFMRFLGRFDTVLFEGHDSAQVESERFREVGFTHVDLIATSERGRPVLVARK